MMRACVSAVLVCALLAACDPFEGAKPMTGAAIAAAVKECEELGLKAAFWYQPLSNNPIAYKGYQCQLAADVERVEQRR